MPSAIDQRPSRTVAAPERLTALYRAPDFAAPHLVAAPAARTVAAEADGVLPDDFFATSNLPTYVKGTDGIWRMPREPRMDGCLVPGGGATWRVVEARQVKRGDAVAVGRAEDGGDGIFVHPHGFVASPATADEFRFMSTEVSRERPIDYRSLARMLLAERERGGRVIWVVGPALVHARARDVLAWFVHNGFVQALLAGNAVAVHDIEAAVGGTTLGMTDAGASVQGGHGSHLRAINVVRRAGSIERAVRNGLIRDGIMHACVTAGVPWVLCGSIRDDGPLPDVITDALAAQDAMREYTKTATMSVMVATALHSIAVGNMLPTYCEDPRRGIVPLPTICVDVTEFLVAKLRDRGTQQAVGVVTNAQDFLSMLRSAIEREVIGNRVGPQRS